MNFLPKRIMTECRIRRIEEKMRKDNEKFRDSKDNILDYTFTWQAFDISFLKEIILEANIIDDPENVIASDDKDLMIKAVLYICLLPDENFIIKYRKIIERYLLRYPEEVIKICERLKITSGSYENRYDEMTNTALSTALINAYLSALQGISNLYTESEEYELARSLKKDDRPIIRVLLYK